MRIRHLALGAVLLVALSACGSAAKGSGTSPHGLSPVTSPGSPATKPTAVPAASGLVSTRGLVTILQSSDSKPELCLGAVADSLPPQCGGPEVVGWTWSEHRGTFESRSGVRWGQYAVTGHFDGVRFTPTEVVPDAVYDAKADPDADDESEFETPCPAPDGGWKVIDPARTTEASMEAAFTLAEKLDGYADSWVDQSRNPANGTDDEEAMNDPKYTTINVRVAQDKAGAEKALRKVWGGALCVSEAEHTAKELAAIQDAVNDLPGLLVSGPQDGGVTVQVIYDDGSFQRWADEEFGKGLVEVGSALEPVRSTHP